MNYTVIGHHVNIAHRLQLEAKASQILITARTLSGIKDMIETEEIKNVKLKGISEPITVYNVIGLKDNVLKV